MTKEQATGSKEKSEKVTLTFMVGGKSCEVKINPMKLEALRAKLHPIEPPEQKGVSERPRAMSKKIQSFANLAIGTKFRVLRYNPYDTQLKEGEIVSVTEIGAVDSFQVNGKHWFSISKDVGSILEKIPELKAGMQLRVKTKDPYGIHMENGDIITVKAIDDSVGRFTIEEGSFNFDISQIGKIFEIVNPPPKMEVGMKLKVTRDYLLPNRNLLKNEIVTVKGFGQGMFEIAEGGGVFDQKEIGNLFEVVKQVTPVVGMRLRVRKGGTLGSNLVKDELVTITHVGSERFTAGGYLFPKDEIEELFDVVSEKYISKEEVQDALKAGKRFAKFDSSDYTLITQEKEFPLSAKDDGAEWVLKFNANLNRDTVNGILTKQFGDRVIVTKVGELKGSFATGTEFFVWVKGNPVIRVTRASPLPKSSIPKMPAITATPVSKASSTAKRAAETRASRSKKVYSQPIGGIPVFPTRVVNEALDKIWDERMPRLTEWELNDSVVTLDNPQYVVKGSVHGKALEAVNAEHKDPLLDLQYAPRRKTRERGVEKWVERHILINLKSPIKSTTYIRKVTE